VTPEYTERLFSYGTLQTDTVQLSLFGRRLDGHADALVGYCLVTIQVQDQSFVASKKALSGNHGRRVRPNPVEGCPLTAAFAAIGKI
jgi:hypothetical protein